MDDYRTRGRGNTRDSREDAGIYYSLENENPLGYGRENEQVPQGMPEMESGNLATSPLKDNDQVSPAVPRMGPRGLMTPSLPNNYQAPTATPGAGPEELPTPSIPSDQENPIAMPGAGPEGLPTPSLPSDQENPIAMPGAGPEGLPTPSLPGDQSGIPEIPLPPIIGQPDHMGRPEQGMRRANVRILNGAANYGALTVTIGTQTVAEDLPFGTSTQYKKVEEGFRVVTILASSYPRRLIYRQVIPFVSGISITLALINTVNGIGIQVITDIPCIEGQRKLACLRMVNLSYNSRPLDLVLDDGRVVFSDVRFREVTQYKRANPGTYNFKVINSPNRPMPIVSDIALINDLTYQISGRWEALLEFSIDMKANVLYTVYILGNDGYLPALQPYILEN